RDAGARARGPVIGSEELAFHDEQYPPPNSGAHVAGRKGANRDAYLRSAADRDTTTSLRAVHGRPRGAHVCSWTRGRRTRMRWRRTRGASRTTRTNTRP